MGERGKSYPKDTQKPQLDDIVAVLMTEGMARRFEERCLGSNTRGWTELTGPMIFREDDVPTYIIGVGTAASDDSAASGAAPLGEDGPHGQDTDAP